MPILTTKLHIPTSASSVVQRSRLFQVLDTGLEQKLILASAPAGFGKTTIITSWLATKTLPVAWVALDENDSDITRFMLYLISALQTINPNIGQSILSALASPQMFSLDLTLTELVNDLTQIPDDFILVLDDYHTVDSADVDQAISFLLNHGASQLHMIITTREDPNLPLARLRGRGQLTEIRASDLRFTDDEATHFLNSGMDLALSSEQISALEQRTEGWIVGLQLAAISMKNQADKLNFIKNFSGNHQYVLDYLVEEVLQQQSEAIKSFLLQTSILDQFCADLCDAVVDVEVNSQNILNDLIRANLFLIPLDNERKWFRYHHLFQELLRQRLTTSEFDTTTSHIRASEWYEAHDFALEAFQHAVHINDVERVEHLLEGRDRPLLFRGVVKPVLNWLNSLPTDILDEKPSLWVWSAFADSYVGLPTGIENKLDRAEVLLQDTEQDIKTQDLLGRIATVRAMLSVPHNDLERMIIQSKKALKLLHPDNQAVRVQAMWGLGYAHQTSGNRAEAIKAYHDVIAISKTVGNVIILVGVLSSLGQIQESNNQLHIATNTYQNAIDFLEGLHRRNACEALLGLARIAYQRNDLDTAENCGKESLELAIQLQNIDTPAGSHLLLAQVYLAQQDIQATKAEIDLAQTFAEKNNFVHMMPLIAERRIQLLLQQGQIDSAYKVNSPYELPLSSARIDLANGQAENALMTLDSYITEVETRDWKDEVLKARLLKALALHQLDNTEEAFNSLKDALAIGEMEDFVRIFLDEGQAMQHLLSDAQKAGIYPDYTKRLLMLFNTSSHDQPLKPAQNLIEPLSDRELEVLALVADGLSNREISEQLFITLNTVKGHNRIIFQKLDVNRRTEAVARARSLGLI